MRPTIYMRILCMPNIQLTARSYDFLNQLTNHQEKDHHALLDDLVACAFDALPPEDTQPPESSTDETP